MKENYQKILESIIEENQSKDEIPTLFLHSCCAPCSSYVLEYLSEYFSITVFYYNPNIYPDEELETGQGTGGIYSAFSGEISDFFCRRRI